MNVFAKFFGWATKLFTDPRVKAAFVKADEIAAAAEPLVRDIAACVPNTSAFAALKNTLDAYEKYHVQVIPGSDVNHPAIIGNLLLNLATVVLARQFPLVPVNILQTGVQVAVTAVRAAESR